MNIDSTETLGHAIRSMRKQLRLTQPDLAAASGTGLRFIVDLEKGKPTCQLGKALRVLQTLGVQLELAPPRGHTITPLPKAQP